MSDADSKTATLEHTLLGLVCTPWAYCGEGWRDPLHGADDWRELTTWYDTSRDRFVAVLGVDGAQGSFVGYGATRDDAARAALDAAIVTVVALTRRHADLVQLSLPTGI